VDHMSYNTTMEAMKILEARNYSGVVSSHNFLRDKETNIDRVFKLGGMAVTFNGSPSDIAETMQSKKAQMEKYDFEIGVGVGTDIQGLVAQTMGDDGYVPVYPFKSVDGTVTFTEPKIGNRDIDFASEGMAHIGLFAEWMDNFHKVSEERGDGSYEIFMNSAEAYLQLWARAEAAAIE
ncbi:MAG: hypothetical protein MI867_04075, partial [Pseudomonadales bacterium]|nr:hypothetical protein [Pseudomonadales bacterium]